MEAPTTLPVVQQSGNNKVQAMRPERIEEYWQLAQYVATSIFAPKDFQGKPENCLIAMQMGAELGLAPMQAIQSIAVINGRPSIWGDGLLALLQQSAAFDHSAFSETWSGEGRSLACTCTMARVNGSTQTRTFSVEDAAQAGLWGKGGPWKQYPKRMLQMRARGWAARDLFSDVLRGFSVAEEWVGVEETTYEIVDEDTGEVTEPKSRTEAVKNILAKKVQKAPESPQPDAEPDTQAKGDPAAGAQAALPLDKPATEAQMKALHAIGKAKGHDHDALSKIAQATFEVESMKELTSHQASELITSIQG